MVDRIVTYMGASFPFFSEAITENGGIPEEYTSKLNNFYKIQF